MWVSPRATASCSSCAVTTTVTAPAAAPCCSLRRCARIAPAPGSSCMADMRALPNSGCAVATSRVASAADACAHACTILALYRPTRSVQCEAVRDPCLPVPRVPSVVCAVCTLEDPQNHPCHVGWLFAAAPLRALLRELSSSAAPPAQPRPAAPGPVHPLCAAPCCAKPWRRRARPSSCLQAAAPVCATAEYSKRAAIASAAHSKASRAGRCVGVAGMCALPAARAACYAVAGGILGAGMLAFEGPGPHRLLLRWPA